MTAIQAFLGHLIDYAGLFPPAKLPLDQAISNYARYRQDRDAWMLGRFIVPTTRLNELASHRPVVEKSGSVALAVLGRGGAQPSELMANFKLDQADVDHFRQEQGDWATIDVLEMKSPLEAVSSPELLSAIASQAQEHVLTVFHEVALVGNWHEAIENLARRPGQGFKLRCGGLEAAAFPTPAQVASVVVACHDAGVPLKCTAGLHHPLRSFRMDVQTKMHGFLNVFGGGMLARAHHLSSAQLLEIIQDENPPSFGFEENSFRWRNLRIATPGIVDARQHGLLSFGSCSFDEPREDLRTLGLLK